MTIPIGFSLPNLVPRPLVAKFYQEEDWHRRRNLDITNNFFRKTFPLYEFQSSFRSETKDMIINYYTFYGRNVPHYLKLLYDNFLTDGTTVLYLIF